MKKVLTILKKIYHYKIFNIRLNVFVYFIGLSFIFWLLNALNKEYSTDVSFDIKYTKIPNSKIIRNDFLLPQKIKLHIKGQGFSLLQNKISRYFTSKKLNISSLLKKEDKLTLEKNSFIIEMTDLKFSLEKELSGNVEIINIEPPTIIILFSNISHKKVHVRAVTKIEISKQHKQIGGLQLFPDSINVIGPVELLDTLQYINTKLIKLLELNKQQKRKVELQPIHNIKFSKNRVAYLINVEEIIQNEINIPIQIKNKPTNITVNLYPTSIKIKYSTNITAQKNIENVDFLAFIDYNNLVKNTSGESKVTLEKYPKNIQIINISPEKIKFILEKNYDDKSRINRGIGSGKSHISKAFSILKTPIYNADDKAKSLMQNNKILSDKIKVAFGNSIFNKFGDLQKSKLAQIVFSNKKKLALLNKLVHPFVWEDYANWLIYQKNSLYIIFESAVLIEYAYEKKFDFILLLTSPPALRIKRLIKSKKTDKKSIIRRMVNQLLDNQKMKKADFIIKNDEKRLLIPQILKIHTHLLDSYEKNLCK